MNNPVSRRTLAKGAAWSVPAVAVATAAPLVAASPIVTVSEAGDACKLPGGSCNGWKWGYLQPLTICNHSNSDAVTVTFASKITLSLGGTPTVFTPDPKSFTIQPGECEQVVLHLDNHGNSENTSIRGTINWTWTAGKQSGTGTTQIDTGYTPPCVDCKPTFSA